MPKMSLELNTISHLLHNKKVPVHGKLELFKNNVRTDAIDKRQ